MVTKRIVLFMLVVLAMTAGLASAASDVGISVGASVGSGAFTTTTNYTGDVQVSAPMLITSPGYYILTQNISSTSSAIGIMSNGVTLDLNGYTITYGTGNVQATNIMTYDGSQSGNVGHFGIITANDPRETSDYSFNWNSAYTGIVIKNGTISDGTGTGLAFSNGMDLTGASAPSVSNLVINTSCPDSQAIIATDNPAISNCTLNSTSTFVTNRHQSIAQLDLYWQSDQTYAGGSVSNCIVKGSPQEGIDAAHNNTVVHDNLVQTNALYTNCYGINTGGTYNVSIYNNAIIPTNGRGIYLTGSSGINAYNNYVEVREVPNLEYQTSMQTHGIKIDGSDTGTNGISVYNNVVESVSTTNSYGNGQPTPLNLTLVGSGNNIHNNRIIANNTGSAPAWGIYMNQNGDGSGTAIQDQTVYSNVYGVGIPWEGVTNHTFTRIDFRKIKSSDSVTLMDISNGNDSGDTDKATGQQFVDCQFYGMDPTVYHTGYTTDACDWDYAVGYSLALTAKNGGAVLSGATVTITCPNNNTITGTTDSNGNFTANLNKFKVIHIQNSPTTTTTYGTYTVTITKTGVTTRAFTLNSASPMAVTTDVTGSGLQNLCQAVPKRPDWGLAYNYGLSTDGTTAPTWSITAGSLPTGLSISSGAITGTPSQVGIYNFTMRGTVGGVNADKAMQLVVVPVWGILGKYNFTATSGGTQSWNSTSNWAYSYGAGCDSDFPNAQGKIANLSVDLTSALTLNLGANTTVGSLIMGDNYGANKYATTISNTGGYTITMDNGGQMGDIKSLSTASSTDIINANIVLNDSMFLNGGSLLTINGGISGQGGLAIRRSDTGAVITAANTYTGDTVVQTGSLALNTTTATATGGNMYVYGNSGSNQGQLFLGTPNGSNSNGNRIGDTKMISMQGGSLEVCGNNTTNQTETMGTLQLGWGDSWIQVMHPTGGYTTTLQSSSLSRLNNATSIVKCNGGETNTLGSTAFLKFTTAPSVIGGGGSTATNKSIIPYLRDSWYDATFNNSYSDSFVTYTAANGVVPLNPGTDYFQADNSSGKTIMNSADTDNVRLIGTSAATDSISVTANKSVNSLLIHPKYASGNNTYNINITSGKILTVTSGAIAANKIDNGSSDVYFNTGTLAFGSNEGIFDVDNGTSTTAGTVRVSGGLTGSGGITLAAGKLYLQDTVKSYTGNTTVNDGSLYAGASQGVNVAGVLPNSTTVVLGNWNGGMYITGTKPTLFVQTGGSGTTSREKIANLRGCGIVNMGSTGKMVIGQNSSKGGPDIASGQLVLDGGTIYVGDTDTSRWDQGALQIQNGSFSMASGTLNLNIGSLTEFGSLALITSGQNATISSGTLNLNILPGFVPDNGDSWNFLTTTSGTVTYNGFSSITTNAPGSFAVTGGGTSMLTVTYSDASGYSTRPVPEPATLALLAMGSLLALRRRNR